MDKTRSFSVQSADTISGDVLRFLTCGSVDDGKSTLIGRLLHDTRLVPEDQLAILEAESKHRGGVDAETDYSLLLDGLEAEREQGITIDVSYRFFATETRKYVVADTPGHEQYTRNMATGASTADVAVILIDARKGVLPQTRRHTYIAHLLGIRHIILTVNKMDLVDHVRGRFVEICADYAKITDDLGFDSIAQIPISAKNGDNVITPSKAMAWYEGPSLLDRLETIEVADRRRQLPFRMPVQWVNRPNQDFRGYSGSLIAGTVRPGDEIVVAVSGRNSKIKRVVTSDGDLDAAYAGDAVTLVLEDEIDISRGDLLTAADTRATVSTQFSTNLLWMNEEEMNPGRAYLMKIGTNLVPATVTTLKHKLDINTMEHRPAQTLALNEIGLVDIRTSQSIAFDPYAEIRQSGAFILIDRYTNKTAGAGMIRHPLRRADNIHRQHTSIDKSARTDLMGHKPAVLWLTGLSGSGKSTIADLVERDLHQRGIHTFLLDGDNIRHGLCCDLGFSEAGRVENIRRVGEVARLFVDAGLVVVCSFISPFRAERQHIRTILGQDEFIEIFIDTPLNVCVERDPKGLYKKAKAGEIPNFTGIDSPYEAPENPELRFDASQDSAASIAAKITEYLSKGSIIS